MTFLLAFVCMTHLYAKGYTQQRLTVTLKNASLPELFQLIQQKTDYQFLYNEEMVARAPRLNVSVRSATVDELLSRCFKDYPLHYRKVHKTVVVLPGKAETIGAPGRTEEADLTIKGTVTDSLGHPLAGVSVSVKGGSNGTVTNPSGQYVLTVPDGQGTLVFSYVGYVRQEVAINGQATLDVVMHASVSALDQLVVVGYGTQKKSDLTGSVAQIDNAELKAVPVYNIGEALQGRASGVRVTHNSGAPGSRIQIRVRGGNSMIGSSDPLYVVDGFPITGGINFLNPADIASIDILKDASATAIYGARGANGVVMVTTKRGQRGENNTVSVSSYYGVQQTAKRFDMLNAKQYAVVANEWLKNAGEAPYFNVDEVKNPGTDWQDAIFRSAPVQNHTLTFSGSSEKSNYSLSGNYYNQEGIIINSGVQKGSFRFNLDHEIKKWLKLAVNLNLSRRQQRSVPVDNGRRGNNLFSGALSAPPGVPIYDENGLPVRIGESYPFTDPGDMRNPMLWNTPYKNQTTANTVLLNSALTFQITPDLSFSTRLGLEYENAMSEGFTPIIYTNDRGAATSGDTYWNSFLNENILTYDKALRHDQHLTVTGGLTYQSYSTRNNHISVSGLANNITENFNLGSAETVNPPTSGFSQWYLVSGLGRVNYDYGGKYLVTASLRADGSSRFGEDNKWGVFPSGAVAWRVSEEPFIKDQTTAIDNLKIRASYGVTGNTALSPYQSLDRMSPVKYIYGGNAEEVGYAPSGISNSQLQWESSDELDLGLDLGLFNSRLSFTFDYYKKNTHNLLASVPLPPSVGFGYILQNFGEIQNQGLEFSVNADIFSGDFSWDVGAQLSTNRNKVMTIAGGSDIITVGQTSGLPGYNIARVGQPLGAFYGYLEDGLDEDGYIQFVDKNNDEAITPLDRVILGSPYPDFEFGFNTNFSYRNFSLNIFLQGTYGNDIFFATAFTNLNSFQRTQNQFADLFGHYWTEDNPDPHAKYPRVSPLTQMRPSDRFIEDGSYLRVKSVQLAYDFPLQQMHVGGLQQLRVYVKATNLFTLTNYPGLDPEVNTRGSDSQSIENRLFIGTDESGYPSARTFGAGLELSF